VPSAGTVHYLGMLIGSKAVMHTDSFVDLVLYKSSLLTELNIFTSIFYLLIYFFDNSRVPFPGLRS